MQDVVIAIQIQNRNCMRSWSQIEILIYVCAQIPAKLDSIIPDLHLANRCGLIGVSNYVNRRHVDRLIR
ncbi:MAG: hypothetical protein C5B46_04480 [Proteobacteria bacterium]|nr:MAG: hypothetical protein C5B46_04480 [Pseudomonadota bacterium]